MHLFSARPGRTGVQCLSALQRHERVRYGSRRVHVASGQYFRRSLHLGLVLRLPIQTELQLDHCHELHFKKECWSLHSTRVDIPPSLYRDFIRKRENLRLLGLRLVSKQRWEDWSYRLQRARGHLDGYQRRREVVHLEWAGSHWRSRRSSEVPQHHIICSLLVLSKCEWQIERKIQAESHGRW